VPRRDPSEKQEPHAVMWGKTNKTQSKPKLEKSKQKAKPNPNLS
jgi:hypothetical protein